MDTDFLASVSIELEDIKRVYIFEHTLFICHTSPRNEARFCMSLLHLEQLESRVVCEPHRAFAWHHFQLKHFSQSFTQVFRGPENANFCKPVLKRKFTIYV